MLKRAIRAEWVKLWSLRGPVWAVAAAAVAIVAGGVLTCAAVADSPRMLVGPIAASMEGVQYARFAVGVLGVLVATQEYSSGLVRWTFAAVPARVPVLAAKALVVTAVTTLLAAPTVPVAFLAGQAMLGSSGLPLGAPGAARALVGAVGQLVAIALLGLALGTLLRSAAGAVGTLVLGVAILPGLLDVAPGDLAGFTPGRAGESMMTAEHLGALPAAGVLAAWVAVALVGAGLLLRRRDA
jgi:ABC-2 type transport system permease protein